MEEKYDQNPNTEGSGSGSYSYENYSSGNGTQDASYSGGGSYYQYNSSGNSFYEEERGPAAGQGTGASGGSGPNRGGKGKIVLALVLALVFGLCAGAGVWGVHRYLNTEAAAAAAEGGAAEQDGEADAAQAQEPEEEPEVKAQEPAEEPAAQAQEPQAQEPGTQPAETEQEPAAQADAAADDVMTNQETVNEAGLIISDSESSGRETQVTKVVQQVMPSIVSVYNSYTQQMQFFGQVYSQEAEATGSGIIIGKTDDKLLIVTNDHVVEGAEQLRVLFIDQESCEAEIIGTDISNDLAVISVKLSDMQSSTLDAVKIATLGNSEKVMVGEDVIAIGNALGYGQSVTTGIVSATEREIQDGSSITGTFIQTDAAINPGNSGGALVNINGEVIGINSNKIGGDTVEGMGFAIPISRAIPIIGELITQESRPKVEEAKQGTIGISGQSVTSDIASAYNMPQGVYVFQILENGGAASSDLQVGDVITAMDGKEVKTMENLQRMLEYYEADTTVTLTVQRQGQDRSYHELSVQVTLGTKESINSSSDGRGRDGRPGQSQTVPEQTAPEQTVPENGVNEEEGIEEGQEQVPPADEQNGYGGQYQEQMSPFGFSFGF